MVVFILKLYLLFPRGLFLVLKELKIMCYKILLILIKNPQVEIRKQIMTPKRRLL